jgi:hypothetical protein
MEILKLYRTSHIRTLVASVLAFVFSNYSINTIDKEYKSNHQTSSALEIETFTELVLDEILQMPGILADSEEHENETSTGCVFLFFLTTADSLLLNKTFRFLTLQNLFIEDLFSSHKPNTIIPPPKVS